LNSFLVVHHLVVTEGEKTRMEATKQSKKLGLLLDVDPPSASVVLSRWSSLDFLPSFLPSFLCSQSAALFLLSCLILSPDDG